MTNDKLWAIRLPSDLYERLVEQAQLEERTPASIMRLLARQYLDSLPLDDMNAASRRADS